MQRIIKSKEFTNTLLYFSYSFVSGILSFITLPIFTTYLDANDYGIWGYVMALNTFLIPFFILGLNSYFIKEYFALENEVEKKKLLSNIFWFTCLWTVVCTIILILIGGLIFRAADISVPFFPFMLLILLSNISIPFVTYLPLKLRVDKKALQYSMVMLSKLVLILIFSVLLVAVFDLGLEGRIIGVVLGNIFFIIFTSFLLKKDLIFHFDFIQIKLALNKSFPLIWSTVAILLFDVVDRLFLERMVSMEEMGYYNVGNQYANIMFMVSVAFYKAYEPEIFRLSKARDHVKIDKVLSLVVLFFFLIAITLILISPKAIEILTHGRFISSVEVSQLLIVAYVAKGIYTLMNTYLISLFKTRVILTISVIGLILLIGMNYILVPAYGSTGAAMAKMFLFMLIFVLTWLISSRLKHFYRFFLVSCLIMAILYFII